MTKKGYESMELELDYEVMVKLVRYMIKEYSDSSLGVFDEFVSLESTTSYPRMEIIKDALFNAVMNQAITISLIEKLEEDENGQE